MAAARVAFLGTHNWRAHEAVRWWSAAHGQEERAAAEGSPVSPQQLDVFGVARPPLDLQRVLVWHGLRPGEDTRMARAAGVDAVVCSGQGPNDVQIVKDCLRAGKAVFVESLERFQPSDLAEIAAATASEAEGGRPALMSGLYLRFDSVMQEAVELGVESLVGRPLLYQAHASAAAPSVAGRVAIPFLRHHRYAPVTPSLYELGMEQVDALRYLLKAEPTEVYAVGALAPGAPQEGAGLGAYQALTLTIRTSAGVPAVITLDTRGCSAPRQRIALVGDANRVAFTGAVGAAELQEAGINHFLDVVTEASALVEGARQLVQGSRKAGAAGGTATPPERSASEGEEEEEEKVSTPPHQGTPAPKSVSTPESPPLLPSSHLH
ncbi:hypothetical protein ABPG75_004904 [Micractinium tetrahymenae]